MFIYQRIIYILMRCYQCKHICKSLYVLNFLKPTDYVMHQQV